MIIAAGPAASTVVPGVLGFLVVAAIGLVCYFLFRSLNKQLRKVVVAPPWREGGKDGRPAAPSRPPRGLRARGMLPVQDEPGPAGGDAQGEGSRRP